MNNGILLVKGVGTYIRIIQEELRNMTTLRAFLRVTANVLKEHQFANEFSFKL